MYLQKLSHPKRSVLLLSRLVFGPHVNISADVDMRIYTQHVMNTVAHG